MIEIHYEVGELASREAELQQSKRVRAAARWLLIQLSLASWPEQPLEVQEARRALGRELAQ